MRSFFALLSLGLAAVARAEEHSLVRGVVILARNGDRFEYFQDPITYRPFETEATALGASQSHQLGAYLRSTYLDGKSASHIRGVNGELVDNKQVYVRAKAGGEGHVIFDSAIALLQGLFPPTPKNSITLANGTFVTAPLGGYQYVPIETVEPGNDKSLESWTNCPAFEKHVTKTMESGTFRKHADAAQGFLDTVKGYVFGPSVKFDNMWNVYEFVHSQLTHNRTYAFRLPPTLAEQARHHVNVQQAAIFGSDEIGSIANVAGRTLLRSILNALSRVAYNGDPLQLHLTEAPYQPFISLMHMLELDNENPALRGLPNFASALAIELRRGDEDDSRDYLRFRFKNGTADGAFRTFHAFGHSGDIPLAEFIYRTQPYQIANSGQLRQVCGSGSLAEVAQAAVVGGATPAVFGGAIAVALLAALFVLAKARKAAYGRIRLAEIENGKVPARF